MSDAIPFTAAPERAAAPAWLERVPPWWPAVAIATAVFAGQTLLDAPVGLAFSIVGVAVVASVAAISPGDAWRRCWWAMACALMCVATLRAAGWLVSLSVCAALLLAAVAAGGAVSWRGLHASIARGLAGLIPGPFIVGAAAGQHASGRWGAAFPVLRGLILAALVATPFLALFAAADATFSELIEDVGGSLPDLDEELPNRLLIAAAVLAPAGALVRAALRPAGLRAWPERRGALGRTEWALALGALNVVFVAFLLTQVAAMWGGEDYLMRTAGLTRAEYAREGFGQLVGVAALTLVVIAASRMWSELRDEREERLQRFLLGALCVLTLVVLVSAWGRLDLYVDAFGQTRTRLFAQTEILWLAGVFGLLLAAGRRPWLPRAVVTWTGATVLLLGLVNPDARIASHNVDRWERTGKFDATYAQCSLSADAVPALLELPPRLAAEAIMPPGRRGGFAFNAGRHRARSAYEEAGLSAATERRCGWDVYD